MKRTAVLKRLARASKMRGLIFTTVGGTRHTMVTVGQTARMIGRHAEVDDVTARKFFDQFADELGKGWWR